MANSTGSDFDQPISLFNVIPGGSYILQLPGSGLLLRSENVVRGAVAFGLKWVFGGAPVLEPEPTPEASDTNYNAVHSAVQELVEMFDDEVRPDRGVDTLSGIDLLRAAKIRVGSLETQVKAERQARIRAESRIVELKRIPQVASEANIQKLAIVEQELVSAKRDLAKAQVHVLNLQEKWHFEDIDVSSDSQIEQGINKLQLMLDDEGKLMLQSLPAI